MKAFCYAEAETDQYPFLATIETPAEDHKPASTAEAKRASPFRVHFDISSGTYIGVSKTPMTFRISTIALRAETKRLSDTAPPAQPIFFHLPSRLKDTPKAQDNTAAIALLDSWLSGPLGVDPEQQKSLEATINSMNEERDRVAAGRVFP